MTDFAAAGQRTVPARGTASLLTAARARRRFPGCTLERAPG